MKASLGSLAQVQPQRLWSVAVAGCLLVPMLFLTVLRQQGSPPLSIMNLQVSIVANHGPALLAGDFAGGDTALGRVDRAKLLVENTTVPSGDGVEKPTPQAAEEASSASKLASLIQQVEGSGRPAIEGGQPTSSPAELEDMRSPAAPSDAGGRAAPSTSGGDSGSQKPETSTAAEEQGRITCDFTHVRTDICELHGDVRINGSSSSVVLASPAPAANTSGWTIKPYARKWETNTMAFITRFSITAQGGAGGAVAPAPCVNNIRSHADSSMHKASSTADISRMQSVSDSPSSSMHNTIHMQDVSNVQDSNNT